MYSEYTYEEYERPEISFALFYYDEDYERSTSEKVLNSLEKYGFFPPEKIYIDRMTRGRFVYYKPHMREMFIEAYSKPGVCNMSMADGDSRKVEELWKFDWGFTFIKTKMLTKEPRRGTLKPWNVLTLSMTYGRFRDPEIYSNFFSFAKSVITDIDPFYARLDDIANGLDVFHSVNEDCFEPGRIQQIYWGNYLGSDYCEKYNVGDGSGIPAYSVEKLGNGVFFTLSDNVLDFASEECVRRREMLRKHFDLKVRTKKRGGTIGL